MIRQVLAWQERNGALIERLGLALLGIFLVSRWVDIFILSPDSAQYLTAAMNLVDHGSLFIWTNWPSYSFLPEPEVYAIYPPGYALYLAAFYFFFREPMLAAFLAQSAAIALFCWAVRAAAQRVGLRPWERLAVLAFVAVFPTYHLTFPSLLTETLFMALSLGVMVRCIDLMDRGWNRTDLLQAWAALFAVSSVRWNGLANAVFFILPLWRLGHERGWSRAALRLVITAMISLAPVALWMIRNRMVTGKNAGHYSPVFFLWDRLWTPFEHTLMRWGLGSGWLLLAVFALALWPLLTKQARVWQVGLGLLGHFLVIYLLTLMFAVTPLDDRYIGPSYLFLIILLVLGVARVLRRWEFPARYALGAMVLGLLATVPAKSIRNFRDWNEPPQRELWKLIRERPWSAGASHFYSDDDWVHQVFARMPQRIVFDEIPQRAPERIPGFWDVGQRPFWITRDGTPLHKFMESHERPRLKNLRSEVWNGYTLYWRDAPTSPAPRPGSTRPRERRGSTPGSAGAQG